MSLVPSLRSVALRQGDSAKYSPVILQVNERIMKNPSATDNGKDKGFR